MQSHLGLRSLLHHFKPETDSEHCELSVPNPILRASQHHPYDAMPENLEVIALVYPDGSVAHLDLQQSMA
jgi:hypothetical protein